VQLCIKPIVFFFLFFFFFFSQFLGQNLFFDLDHSNVFWSIENSWCNMTKSLSSSPSERLHLQSLSLGESEEVMGTLRLSLKLKY